MPSTYTTNNGIELIATGEQSGTWGATTNTNLSLVDAALDGQVTITLVATGSSGSPNALPVTDGSASNGRNRLIIFADGGDLGGTAFVQLTPNDAEKIVYIRNSLTASRSILVFQGTYNASNDYEIPAGTTAVVYFDGGGAGAVAANVFNNAYFDSLRLGAVSVTAILDEDNMASDSATSLATQQSIKAYVDTQLTAEDLDFAGGTGTGAVDLDSQTFTIAGTANEIETSASGQTLTVGLPSAVTIGTSLAVNAITDANAGNTATINSVTPNVNNVVGKNRIIGGDFTTNPWQRGTSFAAIASGAYFADRWINANNTTAVVTASKAVDSPTATQAGIFTQHCMSLAVTTADTAVALNDIFVIRQYIEGLNTASFGFGQTGSRNVTLSFWVKGTKIGIHCVRLTNGASNRSYVAEYTIATTNTWEYKTITIPVDTTGTWLYDTGTGIELAFILISGTDFHTTANTWTAGNLFATANQVNALDSTANTFKIALVQLEAGSSATAFEYRQYGTELSLCQRYYEKSYPSAIVPGVTAFHTGFVSTTSASAAATQASGTRFTVPKRAAPTAVIYNAVTGATPAAYRVSDGANVTVTAYHINETSIGYLDVPSSANGYFWHFTASAEL